MDGKGVVSLIILNSSLGGCFANHHLLLLSPLFFWTLWKILLKIEWDNIWDRLHEPIFLTIGLGNSSMWTLLVIAFYKFNGRESNTLSVTSATTIHHSEITSGALVPRYIEVWTIELFRTYKETAGDTHIV